MLTDQFHVYDTTLRDGAQWEGLSLSIDDKLAIAAQLDRVGVGFIEGGWPGANPKDTEFFHRARTELSLEHAALAAFGSTRKAGGNVETDSQVAALRYSGAPVVTLVAKSHERHVIEALHTTLEENLEMIAETIGYLRGAGQRVFLDAEHFFDGYELNPDYARQVVVVAAEAGADVVILCDTNGGKLPFEVEAIVREVHDETGVRLGIHCHNDTECAVANTLAAVNAGVTHVQGTANGYGERCGNANLFSIIADLSVRVGWDVLPPGGLANLTPVAHAIAEIANVPPMTHQPWVGASAFAHKAGLHASALKVSPDMYQQADPEVVGNSMRVLVSELAGRASIELKGAELGYDLSSNREQTGRVVERIKKLEAEGYSFEAADASFELLLAEELDGGLERPYTLESWRVIVDRSGNGDSLTEAIVKLHAKGERIVATGEGQGPVNALDVALRNGMQALYPELGRLELSDYKVRILDGLHGTAATTRVLITMSDGDGSWCSTGVAPSVIDASWKALDDAYVYGLLRLRGTVGSARA